MSKINAKEALENTISKKKEIFYEKIKKSIEKGWFSLGFRWDEYRANWEQLMNKELEEQGYEIIVENGWVYIYWGN